MTKTEGEERTETENGTGIVIGTETGTGSGSAASLTRLPKEMVMRVIGILSIMELVRFVDEVVMSDNLFRKRWQSSEFVNSLLTLDNRQCTIESLRWVLNRGFKITNFTVPCFWKVNEEYYVESPFEWACIEGDLQILQAYIELNGADVNADHNGRTPLVLACCHGHIKCVIALLNNGAGVSVNTSGHCGKTPKYRMTPNNGTPLIHACKGGHIETVKIILKAGADVNSHDDESYTPLMYAAEGEHKEIVKILYDAHADVMNAACLNMNKMNNINNTALHMASRHDDAEVLKSLLELGADVNSVGHIGKTPLSYAVFYYCLESVKELLATGANFNHQRDDGQTPLDIAHSSYHTHPARGEKNICYNC